MGSVVRVWTAGPKEPHGVCSEGVDSWPQRARWEAGTCPASPRCRVLARMGWRSGGWRSGGVGAQRPSGRAEEERKVGWSLSRLLWAGWAVLRQGCRGRTPLGRKAGGVRPGWLTASLLLNLQGPSPPACTLTPFLAPGSPGASAPGLGWGPAVLFQWRTRPRHHGSQACPAHPSAQSWTPSPSGGPEPPNAASKAPGSPSESPPVLSARMGDSVSPQGQA